MAFNFINSFGSPFILYSSLKHEGYLVIGSGVKFKVTIKRPELQSHVTFNAVDLGGSELLLSGQTNVSEQVVSGYPKFQDVFVA